MELIEREALYQALHDAGGCDAEPESYADGWDKAIDEAIAMLEAAPVINIKRAKSEIIAEFADLIRRAESKHAASNEAMSYQDKLKQDILHRFELQELTEEQQLELDAKLIECLKERRIYKDDVEVLEPIKKFVLENRNLLNKLNQLLGEVRKKEAYHAERSYRPRVLKEE